MRSCKCSYQNLISLPSPGEASRHQRTLCSEQFLKAIEATQTLSAVKAETLSLGQLSANQ